MISSALAFASATIESALRCASDMIFSTIASLLIGFYYAMNAALAAVSRRDSVAGIITPRRDTKSARTA